MRSFHNTAAGTLTPGRIDVCSYKPVPQHAFADFNGDGGQDLLISRRCGYEAAELHLSGTLPPVVFARADFAEHYEVFVTDHNDDGTPDVGLITTNGQTGTTTVRHFVNNGAGAFTEA
ncbi:hypothetical protein [Actinokineospora sp. NBRC 105648]|uniref:hypothetical protein n=1 Tax=Actinokineospora sp. NBRC 105648 TaxID=3032206 RepID=UPI0024A4D3D8|nr:hypothetical protein [Actinokineospora sp. NBRC 105648]GLZ39713.1 hypothetical protein Acsp05_33370 [Actinokineospora sp. NBRC 105648]